MPKLFQGAIYVIILTITLAGAIYAIYMIFKNVGGGLINIFKSTPEIPLEVRERQAEAERQKQEKIEKGIENYFIEEWNKKQNIEKFTIKKYDELRGFLSSFLIAIVCFLLLCVNKEFELGVSFLGYPLIIVGGALLIVMRTNAEEEDKNNRFYKLKNEGKIQEKFTYDEDLIYTNSRTIIILYAIGKFVIILSKLLIIILALYLGIRFLGSIGTTGIIIILLVLILLK